MSMFRHLALSLFLSAPRRVLPWLACALPALATSLGAAGKPASDSARVTSTLSPDGGRIVIEAQSTPTPVPVFYSASVQHAIRIAPAAMEGEWHVQFHVVQGSPQMLTLGLSGRGDIVEVDGDDLRDWAVRTTDAGRFLDLRLHRDQKQSAAGETFDFIITTVQRQVKVPGQTSILLATPGDAVGFTSQVRLEISPALDLRIASAAGLLPVNTSASGEISRIREFHSTTGSRLEVHLLPRGSGLAGAELLQARLTGQVDAAARTVRFQLHGQLRAEKIGARVRLLAGDAALPDLTSGDGWHIELVALEDDEFGYDLVADRVGVTHFQLPIVAVLQRNGDWHGVDFVMPGSAVVPVTLAGLDANVEFSAKAPVVPVASSAGAWEGYLPADGTVSFAWRRTREAGAETLSFTSHELAEVRVGAGLLRQASHIQFRVLQGKLLAVDLTLAGPGEILAVEGPNVLAWQVTQANGDRRLQVQLSRPFEAEGTLLVRSQSTLDAFPVRAEPLRLTPEGSVRHSGFLRVANSGAVRLEVADATGLMQLAPAQYPGEAPEEGVRQVFVYRFPSGSYAYQIAAAQIQPEVNVAEIVTHELGETDRVIAADIELDIREAPLRDWSLQLPADYTPVSVAGSAVADYLAETEAIDGYRTLRILFNGPVDGRQLVRLRLEKNEVAAAGTWTLPVLRYAGAKSVRGHIGAVAAPGFRFAPAQVDQLAEIPLSHFPRQAAGLQQAWRLRDAAWTATLNIEALGKSVEADVFHLYSLKEGVVHGSVLLNYFVVGAPANEWRIEVPAAVGNIDVIGQNVRRDWRRDGDELIVSLHQPVLGAATLLITFEQPMSARGGTLRPGEIRPLNVQGERGYIQVVSPLQVKHAVRAADGRLLRLEALELPAEFRLLTNSPSLAVYQYTARPFTLELDVEWYEPGEMVDQVVDFAKLSSQVARDGQVVTDARFFVKTRGRKALRLVLPESVKLWEARVDQEIVHAHADGEQTLLPLPPRLNPSEPVEVALRLGQLPSGDGSRLSLTAPQLHVPVVISEWTLRSDGGRLLVPRGGNAELVRPVLTESGFEWISTRGHLGVVVALGLAALGFLLLRRGPGWRGMIGLTSLACAAFLIVVLASRSITQQRANTAEVIYTATIVPAGDPVTVELANVVPWRALTSTWGIALAVVGVGLLLATMAPHERWKFGRASRLFMPLGVAMLSAGLLAQHGGAPLFFMAAGMTLMTFVVATAWARWRRERSAAAAKSNAASRTNPEPPNASPQAGVVSLLLLVATLGGLFGTASEVRANAIDWEEELETTSETTKPAQAIVQKWRIQDGRLSAEVEFTVRGAVGDAFRLLRAPAVLTGFQSDGLRATKLVRDGAYVYHVVAERDGTWSGRATYELPVPDLKAGLPVLTGPAARHELAIDLDQGGWEFHADRAMLVVTNGDDAGNHSRATLVLAPELEPVIEVRPRTRDVSTEATRYFAEVANLYLPGPGVVNGLARVTIRPTQGRVSSLMLLVPDGFTVGDVKRGPVSGWRFDPASRQLSVTVEPAQAAAFSFEVETQLGTGALPVELSLSPLRVTESAGEVGTLALAFGDDAQPEAVRPEDFAAISIGDFEAGLLPRTSAGQPIVVLQHAWRYSGATGTVNLKVAPVAPEVRVTGRHLYSLGDERLVVRSDLHVAITRVGLFKLSFVLPDNLELESLSGPALSQWTEAREHGARIITLHLNGRTLGDQTFAAVLAGPAPAPQASWSVPRVLVREATRQTGELLLVPEKGIRLRGVDRRNAAQLDPRAAGGREPGTLAFRLLQADWSLGIGIEALEPWITVQALHDVTMREGQTLSRLALRYRVENASVKTLQVRLPGLTEDQARTVRGTGPLVSDFVRVAGETDIWEVRFQRGVSGETDVQVEFQGPAAREENRERVAAPEFPGVRQTNLFVAIRAGGRLELQGDVTPRGWQRVDWTAVPTNLQERTDRTVPTFSFRTAEPEGPLGVLVRRHDIADALKLRVTQAELATIFSPGGSFLTAVNLQIDVLEKSTLRVRLPAGARLFNTLVNGQSLPVVREGDEYLFHVFPPAGQNAAASVRLVYAVTQAADGRITLAGPSLSVPLENVTWRVIVPPGHQLTGHDGELRLQGATYAGWYGVDEYQTSIASRRSAEAKKAAALLEEATTLLQRGDQERASEMLSQVTNFSGVMDEAANEDARVQLRALKEQQAMLSLNTRRQRLYLGNRADASRNEQLEQAAAINPFMQGKVNFDPSTVDQLLMGNSLEENTALRGIAARIVAQQLDAEPAPGAIDLTLPERGSVFTFTRSLQVDGSAPLELKLDLDRLGGVSPWFAGVVLAALAMIGLLAQLRPANQ